jgi:hypothetical protein
VKEAGIEITFRQSFFSDPAVPVKNLKVGWPGMVGSACRGVGLGDGGQLKRRVRWGQTFILRGNSVSWGKFSSVFQLTFIHCPLNIILH